MPSFLANLRNCCRLAVAFFAAALSGPLMAHHPMGGTVPTTAWTGLLSGLGHPVIELDHLLFLLGAATVAALARVQALRALWLLVLYALAGAAGTAALVSGSELAFAEAAVAATLMLIALWLWTRQPESAWLWAVFAASGGFFHGYAYGEAVLGAETTPLASYLFGLAMIQALLMVGAYFASRRLLIAAPRPLKIAARLLGVLAGAVGLWLLWSLRLLA